MKKPIVSAAASLLLLLPSSALAGASRDEARLEASRALRSLCERPERPPLAELVHAGREASERLGDARYAHLITDLVEDARWRAILDEAAAARWLLERFDLAAEDLSFQPRREAALPVGFPELTPVGEVELKRYPAYRRASLKAASETGGFWVLFEHIKRNDIAMTAPVELTYSAQEEELRQSRMAFLYRSSRIGELGEDGAVEVVDVAPARTVSIGCRGLRTERAVEEARRAVMEWIERRPLLRVDGELRILGYNSPMVPVSQSYWELQIPVRIDVVGGRVIGPVHRP